MNDLKSLELLIAVMVALFIARPMVQLFRGIDGIVALAPLAAALTALVFLGYGFRPELLPFAIVVFIVFLSSFPRLLDLAHRMRMDDYGEGNRLGILLALVIVAATALFAVAFTPYPMVDASRLPVRFSTERDDERETDLNFTYFRDPASGALGLSGSILIVSPPPIGSTGILETFSEMLAKRGITVVVVMRKSADAVVSVKNGYVHFPSAGSLYSLACSALAGTSYVFAAERGAILERERAADLEFAVKRIRSAIAEGSSPVDGCDPERIAVAGFAEGGAGAILYAAKTDGLLAAVSVEGPIHSALSSLRERRPIGSEPGDNRLAAVARSLRDRIMNALPERVSVIGELPSPVIPSLFIVSDRVVSPRERDGRYATVIRAFRKAAAPSLLVSFDGAGPRDFTDVPYKYPVLSYMAAGLKATADPKDPIKSEVLPDTAESRNPMRYSMAAANATADFLERSVAIAERGIPVDYPLAVGMKAEIAGLWKSGAAEGILRP